MTEQRHSARPADGRWGVVVMVAALVWLATAAGWAQQKVYVKVDDAKIRSGTTATAPVVASPARGAELTVLEAAGPRYKVRTADGREGYVSRLHVSDTKHSSGGGALSGLGRSTVQANEKQTVSSIRGLSPAAKRMAQDEGLSEKAVAWAEKMEQDSAKVTAPEVNEFLAKENIGL